ncbi:unnamed protein product, partial [Candidula unifasciata]
MMEANAEDDGYSHQQQQQRTLVRHEGMLHPAFQISGLDSSYRPRSATMPSVLESEDLTVASYYSDTAAVTTEKLARRKKKYIASVRARGFVQSEHLENDEVDLEGSNVLLAENYIEANRISNNYKFGLKKWKSHVTARPLESRSEIVQDLYSDINTMKEAKGGQDIVEISTWHPCNILYTLLIGWWLSLVYVIVAAFMALTVVGLPY